jgi:class 3 adenylate cyclase
LRVQDLTKVLGAPLLATAPFAAAVPGSWRALGEHVLRGFETSMPILTMD